MRISYAAGYIFFMQLHYFLVMSQYSNFSNVNIIQNICFAISILFIVARYVHPNAKFTKETISVLFAVGCCAFASFLFSEGQTFIKLILFGIALRGVPFERMLQYYFKATSSCTLFVVGSAALGIIENSSFINDGVTYYSLGFNNPNTAAIFLFVLIVTFNCIYYKKLSWGMLLIEITFPFLILAVTDSRSVMVSLIIMLILMFFDKVKINLIFNGLFTILLKYLFILIGAVSYGIAKYYSAENPIFFKLNEMLSWRPFFFHKYFVNVEVTLFGNAIHLDSIGALDNAYLMLLYRYGIVVFLLYCAIFIFVSNEFISTGNKKMLTIVIVYEIYFFMEFTPILVNVNIVLLYFIAQFWNKYKQRNRWLIKEKRAGSERYRNQYSCANL